MAIYRLLQHTVLTPEDIARVTAAYEQALLALQLKDRPDRATELVAKKIIEIARTGVREPEQICKRALAALGAPPSD